MLTRLAESCHGDARPECAILDDLAGVVGREGPAAPQEVRLKLDPGRHYCP